MTTARDNCSNNAPKNAMRDTQERRMRAIRDKALEISRLAERYYIDGETNYLGIEKQIVSRLNDIIRNLSPFATEDESIETHGTYWTPAESSER